MKIYKVSFLVASVFLFSCTNDTDLLSEQNELSGASALKGGSNKVEVCHFDSVTGEYETLLVSSKSAEKHLAHGDYLGACITSVIYDFDSCTLEDLVQVTGPSYITQNGLSGCGRRLPSQLGVP